MTSINLSAKPGIQPTAQLYAQGLPTGPALPMSEVAGTGEYTADPAPGTPAGQYLVVFFEGTRKLASGVLEWDGEREVQCASQTSLTAVATAVQAIGTPLQSQDYTAPANGDIAAIRATTADLALAVDAVGEAVGHVPAAVRTDLTPELTRIDAPISSRSTLTAQDIPPSLTLGQADQLRKVAQLHGIGAELRVTETTRTAGDVSQTLSTDAEGNTTVSAA